MRFSESCRNWKLVGHILHVQCLLADGHTWKDTTFDLDTRIGIHDGELHWDMHGFSHHSTDWHLEGTFLVVTCKKHHSTEHHKTRLDLSLRLRNDNGYIIVIAHSEKLSTMLTEVPWMKFRVVAEPDFSVFTTHPVMQHTMARIAESTAQHVSKQMSEMMAAAIAAATVAVTASAMEHISQSMEVMLSSISGDMSAATIEHSTSHFSHLHKFKTENGHIELEAHKHHEV